MIKLISAFKLSRGMMRVFFVLAIIIFLLSLCYTWGDVRDAENWRENNVSSSGVTLTAIMTSYTSLNGDTVKVDPPIDNEAAFGWAIYLCLAQTGHEYFVDEHKMAHTHMPYKEFFTLTGTDSFKKCVADEINDTNKKVYQAKVTALSLSFSSVLILYLVLLAGASVIMWIVRGFRSNL